MAETTVISPLLGKVQELALNEAKALVNVKDDIRRLRDKLMWLHAFLMEADPVRRISGNVRLRVLVNQMLTVALDAEDAIEKYSTLVDPCRSPRGWRRFLDSKLLERLGQGLVVRHHLSGEIAVMNERIEEIIKNKDKYKLDDVGANKSADAAEDNWWKSLPGISAVATRRPPGPGMEGNWCDLVGREYAMQELEKFSWNGKACICFVLGGIGVGKTALVRKAYQDAEIGGKFSVRIWMSFPEGTRDTAIISHIEQALNTDEEALAAATEQSKHERAAGTTSSYHCLVVVDCSYVLFTRQDLDGWLPQASGGGVKIVLPGGPPPAPCPCPRCYRAPSLHSKLPKQFLGL